MRDEPGDNTGRRTKHHGDGIYSKLRPRLGGVVYFIQYHWFDPFEKRARRITERVPADDDGRCRLESARRLKAKREKDKRRPDFVPAHLEEERREAAERAELDRRHPLLFESAAERFLREHADEYARPCAVRGAFRVEEGGRSGMRGPLALAFAGRYLDTITRVDVRQYYLDRMANAGPFTGRTKALTRRAPEQEITFLSALYTFLQDEGHTIENPCHRPRTRRKDSPLAPYRPRHEAPLPAPAALRALFTLEGTANNGRPILDKHARALFALTYYTAARPESEPCRLRHRDVELGEGERWGSVFYHDTKTGKPRRIPLHPEAERYLREILEPVPIGKEDRERRDEALIFRRSLRSGGSAPWDKSSYQKTWNNVRDRVAGDHEQIAGLWLRDLRKVAKTRMVEAGVPEEITKAILGHRGSVADGYYIRNRDAMQRALEILTLGLLAAVLAAGQGGQCGQYGVSQRKKA